ncbi:hypothetical protein EGW08_003417 [Elysia chlorotica]|uniref:G-protein coupled receptors family 1 profile domain-containing protein n=1 Tax=Elysia chlorotica TaxID=188477 RepID=A0A3S1HYR2_ELYCH|nr:hypothetical protein EGW08_003417 [Elysia chlorotica]
MEHLNGTNGSTASLAGENRTLSITTSMDAMDHILLVIPALTWTLLTTGTIGIIGNILTLLVYARLGFSETINISYTALAVSDLCTVLSAMVAGFCLSPAMQALLGHLKVRVDLGRLMTFTGLWPHYASSRTTAFLTAWISLERCLGVLFPIRVKVIITRKVTKVVVSAIFVLGCCPVVFAYIGLVTDSTFDAETNITTLNIYYRSEEGRSFFFEVAVVLYGAIYSVLSWTIVTVCTAFLIVKLRQSGHWRKQNATTISPIPTLRSQGNKNARENRVIKTVVMICSMFIVCSFPISASTLASIVLRDTFSLNSHSRSLFMVNLVIALLFGFHVSWVKVELEEPAWARCRLGISTQVADLSTPTLTPYLALYQPQSSPSP